MSPTDPAPTHPASVPEEIFAGAVPLLANRFSYFFRRKNSLHYWNITTRPLQTIRALDIEALRCAVGHLVGHHAGLRLQLLQEGSEWRQEIVEPRLAKPLVSLTSTHSQGEDVFVECVARNIKFVCGGFSFPGDLFRVLSVQAADGSATLFIAAHHLVVDGYAFSIVLQDFFDLYRQYSGRKSASLPPQTMSLADYSHKSTAYWLGQADEEARYWESLPWGGVRPIPTDHTERPDSHCEKYTACIVKTMPLHDLLLVLSRNEPDTFTFIDVLLAAIGRAYYRWTGHPVLLLAMVFNGRESFAPGVDLTRTVGWLSETVPILIQATLPPGELLYDIHRQTQRAGRRGKSYGVLRFLSRDLPQARQLREHPHPSVSLNVKVPKNVGRSFEGLARPWSDCDQGPENMEDTRRVFHVSGGALFRNRQFHLSWDFSIALFDMETMDTFAGSCMRELELMGHQ